MADYSDIISRLEKAEGPSFKLDCEIWEAVGPKDTNLIAPAVTGSLAQAVWLVEKLLPGWHWVVASHGSATVYQSPVGRRYDGDTGETDSPVIALLIALFRALEDAEQAGGEK